MIEKKISAKQLICLIIISREILAFSFLPSITAPPANQDIWISTLIAFPMQLLLVIPVYFLYKKFPNQSIIQYSQTIFGKAGKVLGLIIICFFIHLTAMTLSQFNLFMTTAIMPETPKLFFIISLTLFCAYAVSKGIEVLGRVSEIITIIITATATLTLVALLISDIDLKGLTPIMEKGLLPVLSGGLSISSRTVEILGLAMILPNLNNGKKAKTVIIISSLLMIMMLLFFVLSTLTTFGIEETKRLTFPFYSVIRLITIGDFIERTEIIHIGIWILGMFIKVSFYYYLSVLGISQLFNLKDYKPLIIPTGVFIIPLSILLVPSIVELREFTSYKVFTGYSLFFIFIIPVTLLIIALLRKKGVYQK